MEDPPGGRWRAFASLGKPVKGGIQEDRTWTAVEQITFCVLRDASSSFETPPDGGSSG
jgi:hypothetical protein